MISIGSWIVGITKSQDDAHESEEVQRRFKALKAALNTPPEHTKDRPRKRSESKPAAKTASC
jgi:hypothetical protein